MSNGWIKIIKIPLRFSFYVCGLEHESFLYHKSCAVIGWTLPPKLLRQLRIQHAAMTVKHQVCEDAAKNRILQICHSCNRKTLSVYPPLKVPQHTEQRKEMEIFSLVEANNWGRKVQHLNFKIFLTIMHGSHVTYKSHLGNTLLSKTIPLPHPKLFFQ